MSGGISASGGRQLASSAPTIGKTPFDESFARLDLSGRNCVVLAVSGGSDSTALLHFFAGFARQTYPALKLIAVTVDHGLRAEAAEEARQVGAIAAGLGTSHTVKRWDGDKPKTGLMEAAREARYRLLAEAARQAGTDLVLVAHTLDDLAETVAMRQQRGPGQGSAGMAEATLFEGEIWFARPLLKVRRKGLRQVLTDRGLGWIDDPSNEDPRYERVRTRAAMDDQAVEVLAAKAMAAAVRREQLGRRAALLIELFATMPLPGLIRLDPAFVADADREAAVYALRILFGIAGGGSRLPDETRTASLLDRLRSGPMRATLSRAVLDRRKAGIFLYREMRNLPAIASYAPAPWDGRFRLSGKSAEGLSIGAPDKPTIDAATERAGSEVPASVARAAVASLPAIWSGGACLGLAADAAGITCQPLVAPWARYLPSFDLEPADASARLVGAAKPPASPFASHKEGKA